MKRLLIILPFAFSLLLFACAKKTAFTSSIREKYTLSDAEIRKIQFFTSDDIILLKSENQSGRETKQGELVVSSKTSEDRVLIKKGTPGVIISQKGNTYRISFDTDDRTLPFEAKSDFSAFYLTSDTLIGNKPTVRYGTNQYTISLGNSSVFLQFKLKKLKKYKTNDQVVKGRKID
ncbi:MAG TPA: hypothetical protein DEP18_07840 [Flavobacteriales bacterium]|nr:hypothetical protein [Flavobacteriales bacterium]HRE74947.1 hypothetical protein [Flavobacteriales bacterium]HRE95432.1 hypothetical protein [Flavobacteriales bacterium]HRJ34646.1 hypothetical protein [Flavobacteriales bacterium]HRJ39507.1 hypothetical protein [Flavobacteriales bacterium]